MGKKNYGKSVKTRLLNLMNETGYKYMYLLARYFNERLLYRVSVSQYSGSFRPNIETDESGYFGLEELPVLAKEKNSEEQIKMCFSAYHDKNRQVLFD